MGLMLYSKVLASALFSTGAIPNTAASKTDTPEEERYSSGDAKPALVSFVTVNRELSFISILAQLRIGRRVPGRGAAFYIQT
jgi:hypothetical protein